MQKPDHLARLLREIVDDQYLKKNCRLVYSEDVSPDEEFIVAIGELVPPSTGSREH